MLIRGAGRMMFEWNQVGGKKLWFPIIKSFLTVRSFFDVFLNSLSLES